MSAIVSMVSQIVWNLQFISLAWNQYHFIWRRTAVDVRH